MTYLLVLKGPNAKQTYQLDKDRVLLGRNSNCDIVFPANDFAISREHACILRQQDKFFIEDMGSRNGTFVNNTQIVSRLELKDSDKIRICDFLYSFHDSRVSPRQTPLPPTPLEPKVEPADELEPIMFEASLSSTNSHVMLEAQPAEKIRALIDITNNLSNTLELDSLLPKIVDSLFQLFKQADRGFIILREEANERDKTVERLIPKVIKTRPAAKRDGDQLQQVDRPGMLEDRAGLPERRRRPGSALEHEPEHCRFPHSFGDVRAVVDARKQSLRRHPARHAGPRQEIHAGRSWVAHGRGQAGLGGDGK